MNGLRLKRTSINSKFRFHKEKEMVDFRKGLLLLAVLLVASSLASAQDPAFACTASAAAPPLIRAEGIAEYVGDIVLSCSGGTPTPIGEPVPLVNFRIFGSNTVTSAITMSDDWTESLLAIDEPAHDMVSPLQGPWDTDNGVDPLLGVNTGAGESIDYAHPGVGEQDIYNIFQGQVIAANQIEWRGVPIDPPGTTGSRIIRLTNVRMNAAEMGVSETPVPVPLTLTITATPPGALPINNPEQIVARAVPSLDVSFVGDSDFLACVEPEHEGDCGDFQVEFTELLASAFKRVKNPGDWVELGNYDINTESNYYNSLLDEDFGEGVGVATQGTQLRVGFAQVPEGVTLVPADCFEGTIDASVVESGEDGIVWEIDDEGNRAVFYDTLQVGVEIEYTAGMVETGEGTVTGWYEPTTNSNAIAEWDEAGHPRFKQDVSVNPLDGEPTFTISACQTSLLWPYVTNQAGFDTGMVISNTSMDPFETVLQEGPCTIYYYGFTQGGGPAPDEVVTPTIPAGEQAVWTLSTGDVNQEFDGAPGFQGYVIATCDFQYAHGYAFISPLGLYTDGGAFAQGYLALVMDDPIDYGDRTGSLSEPLSQ